jgi:hypothetical protein
MWLGAAEEVVVWMAVGEGVGEDAEADDETALFLICIRPS